MDSPVLLRKAFYALPPRWRFGVRRAAFFPLDVFEKWSGRRPKNVPPRGMIFTGSGDFVHSGDQIVQRLIDLAGLQKNSSVLDIGCGIGRAARPLAVFLSAEGAYLGIDAVETGIRWCQETFADRPNFRFLHLPIKNDLYRSDGRDAAQAVLPLPMGAFDVALANSVFTHMIAEEVENYAAQIAQSLRPAGRFYATFFILDERSRRSMLPEFAFPHCRGDSFLMDEKVRSANVAFERAWIEAVFAAAGLRARSWHPGFWPGRSPNEGLDFQDIVVFERI